MCSMIMHFIVVLYIVKAQINQTIGQTYTYKNEEIYHVTYINVGL